MVNIDIFYSCKRLKKSSISRREDCYKLKNLKLITITIGKRSKWSFKEKCELLKYELFMRYTIFSQHSTLLNQARLAVLKAKDDHIKVILHAKPHSLYLLNHTHYYCH